jgi:transcription antitermination factor NusG
MIQAKQWYTLLTRSRFENVVFKDIQKKSIEAFLPKIKVKSRRKDRKLMIDVPLFPGFLFVNISLDPLEHLSVLKTFGSVRLLGFSDGPVAVPASHIESLKIITSTGSDIICGTTGTLMKGEMVQVVNGPFAGVRGEFLRHKGKERVIIKIEALGQFAGVEIDRDDVEQLPNILA